MTKPVGMTVMGIDPGETTGWAVCRMTLGKLELISHGQISEEDVWMANFQNSSKYALYRGQALTLMQVVTELEPQVVVIEDFVLRQFTTMKAEGISPVRIGAMLEVWLHEIMPHNEPPWKGKVEWQTPSQIGVMHNARMKEQMPEIYKATAGFPHARDAVRHCEVYRRRRSSKSSK